MKRILFFISMCLIVFSCEKDNVTSSGTNNQTPTHPKQLILGVWKLVKWVDTLTIHENYYPFEQYKCALEVKNISYPSLYISIRKNDDYCYFAENFGAINDFDVYIYNPQYNNYNKTCISTDFSQLCDMNYYECSLSHQNYFRARTSYIANFGMNFKFSPDYTSFASTYQCMWFSSDIYYKIILLNSTEMVLQVQDRIETELNRVYYFKKVNQIGG